MTTFVLLHGAYQGGWIWTKVADRLRAAGHLVYAPSLDGCADRASAMRPGIDTESQGAEIAKLLEFEDLHDVVMVGTSCGGMVMIAAAELVPDRIARVVFADALALKDGEKVRDFIPKPAPIETDIALGLHRDDIVARLFQEFDPETREWAADRMSMSPLATFYQPVKVPTFWSKSWKASVVYCTGAPNPGKAHLERAAKDLNASWHVIETGHFPMLTAPDALTEIILNG